MTKHTEENWKSEIYDNVLKEYGAAIEDALLYGAGWLRVDSAGRIQRVSFNQMKHEEGLQ